MTNIVLRLTLILLFTQNLSYSQECDVLSQGTFEGNFMDMKYIIERQGNFQLEKMEEFGVVYLQKIEKNSNCEYLVKRYKVIENGQLPPPNMNEVVKVTVYKIEDGKLFYKVNLVGTEITLDGFLIKKSNEISDDFKKVLEKE